MASKRYLESVNPMIFNKLPRLEREPTSSFPSSKIQSKSSPVSNPGSENHFNYKGSYFTCLLQSPRGPDQPVACWNPAPTYLHYGPGAMSQPVPAEGSLVGLLLYPSGSQGTQKGKDSLIQGQLMARKKLDSSKCPLPVKKPVVPKPVYAAPTCFLPPRMAPPLGTRVESLQQSPGEAIWALPPATHPLHRGEPHKKVPFSDPSLPMLSSLVLPAKEKLGSPVASSPYYATFEKYRPPPSTLFLEASSSTSHSQRKGPDIPSLSSDSWPKLQPPDASLANQERPAMCYPPPPYPLSPHRAAPLCHPPAPTAGEPSALPSFSFVENREPFPSSYLQPQAPRSYFASPLDPCVPRTVGASVLATPPAKPVAVLRNADLPKDVELPRHPEYPSFTFNPGDASTFHAALARPESGCEQHWVEGLPWHVASGHSSAFQPVCTPEKPSGDSSGLVETFCKREEGREKPKGEEEERPCVGRRAGSPAPRDAHPGERVIPVAAGEGNACEARDPDKELVSPSPSVSPPKGTEDTRDTRAFSSSPPMPVIHNVFSLAPFRDHLDRTKGSAHVLFCMEHLWGDPQPQNTSGSQEPASLRDVSVASSPRSGGSVGQSQEESRYRRAPKKPKPVPPEPGAQEGSADGVGTEELPCGDDVVLDLSLKKRPVEAPGNPQELLSCAERTLDQEVQEEKEAARGKVRVGEGAQPQLLDVGSGDRSKFQSSATFMVKKYKIPLSLLQSTEPPGQVGSPHAPQPSSTPTPTPPASSPSSSSPVPPPGPQPSTISGPSPPEPPLPEVPSPLGKEGLSLAKQFGGPPPKAPSGQYFTTLHTWLCDTISGSVSQSSPELLQQWLKKAESAEELGEMPRSLPKPKNGSKAPTPQRPTKGKEIWLAFQNVATLLANLQSQLEAFMSSCPFPHVVRAGAIFIPIHVVKERLFPKLPGTSVDLVLQKHKVELRPTTLSEERHLRDLELKSCTSRMLKLLALKQLPEIYPDLLNLHWHNSIRQQLGNPGMETLKADGKVTAGRSVKKDALKNMPRTTATWEQKGPQRC